MATETDNTPEAPAQGETSGPAHNNAVRQSWRITLDQLQANLAHNIPEAIELFTWCFSWCIAEENQITLDEFALQVSTDKTTISRIVQGTYKHPQSGQRLPIGERLMKAMRSFKQLAEERAKDTTTGFILTPTAKKIWTACDLARESRSPVFIIGPSHIGKTWALEAYKQAHNHGATLLFRQKVASGRRGMVQPMAEACGYSDSTATDDMLRGFKTAMRKRPNCLLMFDEMHQLSLTTKKNSFFACMETLREIYDETGNGMVFCATSLLLRRIQDNRAEFEQFFRRGVHKLVLPDQPQKGDVAAITEALGLEFPARGESLTVRVGGQPITDSPYEILKQVGREEGLKAITERLRYAGRFAKKASEPLSWAHFIRAHHTIRSSSVATNDWEN